MGSLSPAITSNLLLPPKTLLSFHGGLTASVFPCAGDRPNVIRLSKRSSRRRCVAYAEKNQMSAIDFSDPEWKSKFEDDFEKRFNIPHMLDIFPDAVSYPSTFCLRMRTPVSEEFAKGYPSDEEWHGYINNNDRVLLKVIRYSSPTSAGAECIDPDCTWVEQWIHRAGPREKIYFKPEEVKAAIITCGGLCPGLNDVIRQIVITLEIYGVKKIVGIPFGYRGFGKELAEIPLSRKVVQNVHLSGGSLLGVSRGGPNVSEIVDSMQERGINMLFVLGGNGTHAGANAIHNELRKRGTKVAVVGVPKTIDNDILLMDKTFGFDTAVEEAQRAINSAYIEAHSAYRGVGVVKLMGRSSGFIAMQAALASGQIDICLIPEVPFELHGPHGVLKHLKYLLETKGSAVICVAEGAGQSFLEKTNAKDASGNTVLGDIGVHIQQEIKKYFKELGDPADVKYIDPTYMIRACRANASDGILCTVLGQNAVHGAFAGYSGITVKTFKPQLVSIRNESLLDELKEALAGADYMPEIIPGEQGVIEVARHPDCVTVVTGIVGCAGLTPTVAAIEAGKNIALANKETLIAGGPFVLPLARKHNVKILPADSEHSAIFQCIQGFPEGALRRIILTASGGAFRDWPVEKLKDVKVADALKHPNWSMGKKITVDSATLFNKGLEVIEAHYLYGSDYDDIEIVIHPQSIIHSMVETQDSSVLAQLGWPDMRLPILYTLSWPDRVHCSELTWPRLDLCKLGSLTFKAPDNVKYPSMDLAYAAGRAGGTMTGVLSAANEKAVEMFIDEKIKYLDIFKVVELTCEKHQSELVAAPSLEEIIHYDLWAREYAANVMSSSTGLTPAIAL